MTSNLKTVLLLGLLSGLILLLGRALGGPTGLLVAFGIALVMNVGSYWFSDKIILSAYKAKEVNFDEAPMLYRMVEEISQEAGIPMPRVCIIPDESPNAFATGRNPAHAVVAVTQGILRILSPDELRGVLSHEVGHIVNRDILIQSVAGVMATVIMYVAQMLQFSAIFGNRDDRSGGFGALVMALIAPIAAMLIQMGISRSREFLADSTGAKLCHNPKALASALQKLTTQTAKRPMQLGGQATAHMFIVNPFAGNLKDWFSTHPPVEERIHRLMSM